MERGDWVRVTRTTGGDGEPTSMRGRSTTITTWEGYVHYVSARSGLADIWTGPGAEADYIVSTDIGDEVEVIAPPVETFGPGDVVQNKISGYLYTIGEGGYLPHTTWRWTPLEGSSLFTSDEYERVEN